MFFKKPLEKEIFLFSIPILLSMLTQQLYSTVDTMIVGMNLGISELSAVGNGATIVMAFFIISGGFELASDVIISRYYGLKDYKNITRWVISLLFYTFIGVLMICCIGILFIDQIMVLINVEEAIMPLVKTYSIIYIAGLPFIGVYDVARAIIISLNDSKRSFYYIFASSLLNIILDIIFIRYLSMGVAGAAIATVVAQIAVLIITLMHLYKTLHQYPDFSLKPVISKEDITYLLHIACPSMLQQCGVTFMYLALQAFINPYGEEIVSGYVAMSRIMSLFRQCLVAFSATMGVFSARYIASKNYDLLKESYIYIIKLSCYFNIIVGLIFIFFNKPLAQLFFDVSLHQKAFVFFKVYLICSIFMNFTSGFKFIQESVLRSALKMKQFIYSCMGDMISRVIVTYLLIFIIGDHAFWAGETFARTLGCVISGYYLFKYYKDIGEA